MVRKQFPYYGRLILIFLIGQFGFQAFAQNERIKFGEIFVLKTGETTQSEDGKLKIRLTEVGRTISESGEVEYAELQIGLNGEEQKIFISEKGSRTKKVGRYSIELVNAESFGKANCRLKISCRK